MPHAPLRRLVRVHQRPRGNRDQHRMPHRHGAVENSNPNRPRDGIARVVVTEPTVAPRVRPTRQNLVREVLRQVGARRREGYAVVTGPAPMRRIAALR